MTTTTAPQPTTTSDYTSVIAQDAPLGVQLWPTITPEAAPNFTLAEVARTSRGVRWTYENGSVRWFAVGERVTVWIEDSPTRSKTTTVTGVDPKRFKA